MKKDRKHAIWTVVGILVFVLLLAWCPYEFEQGEGNSTGYPYAGVGAPRTDSQGVVGRAALILASSIVAGGAGLGVISLILWGSAAGKKRRQKELERGLSPAEIEHLKWQKLDELLDRMRANSGLPIPAEVVPRRSP